MWDDDHYDDGDDNDEDSDDNDEDGNGNGNNDDDDDDDDGDDNDDEDDDNDAIMKYTFAYNEHWHHIGDLLESLSEILSICLCQLTMLCPEN